MNNKLVLKKIIFGILLVLFLIVCLYLYFIGKIKSPNSIIGVNSIGNTKFIPKKSNKIVYGFLPYWSVTDYNQDFDKITDLAYFSLFLNGSGTIKMDDNTYKIWKEGKVFNSILEKSAQNGVRNHLTVSIHENDAINAFLNCKECYQRNLSLIREEINSKKYIHGINFDFEYVGSTPKELSFLYVDYIKYISRELKKEYGANFMVVVSTYGDSVKKNRITNVSELNIPEIDYLFIMAYDYFGPTSSVAGPVSPLGGIGKNYEYDVKTTVSDYLELINPAKLILGMPLYGLNFIVNEPRPYATRIIGNDTIGFSIQQNLSAIEFLQNREGAQTLMDINSGTPYFIYTKKDLGITRLVFFENEQSLSLKADLAVSNKLSGIGFWALGYEGKNKSILSFAKKYFTIN